MQVAPLPGDEQARLLGLHALALLDSQPDERFDRITRLAARMFDVPFALVSLVDSDRQWFKSRIGFEEESTTRDLSLCAHAILQQAPLVVPDLLRDPRFFDHPMVRGGQGIRFYAGAPLRLRPGSAFGTLCILDRWPRELASVDVSMLSDLASLVVREMQMLEQATVDDLTGLLSRTGFLVSGQQALSICDRMGAPAVMCGFSLLGREAPNAAEPCQATDHERCEFAALLRQSFRGSDVLARIGPNRFVVLATQSQASDLMAALNRLSALADRSPGTVLRYRFGMVAHDPADSGQVERLVAQVETMLDAFN